MKVTKVALVLLWVPAVLSTNQMRKVYRRQTTGILPVPSPQTTPPTTTPTPTPTTTPPTTTPPTTTPPTTTPPTTTPPTTTPPTTTPPTTTPPTTTKPTTTGQTTKTSVVVTTDGDGQAVTRTLTVKEDITAAPAETSNTDPTPPPKSNSQATIIGLSVAGGVALLGVVAFIVWKMKSKRFSQFDDDDGAAAIKWPEATPEHGVNRAAVAAEAGVASRPADPYGTHATNSTVELDPYQVPPLPQGGYRDDPNIQAGGYYDPYRGPVPGTFASPPQSNDGHGAPWAPAGESIPMSVRRGTPGPPGPGGYDDYRRGSPAPYAGGGAPSIRRGPSPGPNFAGGYPDYGRSSPAPPPPNYNRPPGNDPYGGTA